MEEQEKRTYKKTGKTYSKTYSAVGMDKLKILVQTKAEQGEKKRFSILVDGEVVVSPTHC